MSMNAIFGFLNPKYNTLQRIFNTKFNPYTTPMVFFSFLSEFVQAKYRDRAIKKNRIFQTTGKTQFGGVIEGLMDSYQGPMFVNRLPIAATP